MTISTVSSREFNQRASEVKRATAKGPVIITDRGQPAHVLLSIEDYRKLTGTQVTLGEALAQPAVKDFKFTPPRARPVFRPADLR